jgi:sensor histidine kinase YesM
MAYRRSIFLIDRVFQLRFSFYVCAWVVALCFVYPLIVFNLFDFFLRFLGTHGLTVPPQAIDSIKSTRQEILWLLILLQACYLVLSFLLSLFISHRIAGPVYKLRLAFEQIRNGNVREAVRFRTKDHFVEVAEDFNSMMEHFNKGFDDNIERLGSAIGKLEKVSAKLEGDDRRSLDEALGLLREAREKTPH